MKSFDKIRVSFKETLIVLITSILLIVVGYCCDKVNSPRIDTEPVASIVTETTNTNMTFTTTTTTTTIATTTTTTTTLTLSSKLTTSLSTTQNTTILYNTTTIQTVVQTTNQPNTIQAENNILQGISEAEYIMLCNCVGHEYGSDWVTVDEKAKVVEVIMNRVYSNLFPNTIYEVLTQPYQFSGVWSYINLGTYSSKVTNSVKDAVNYYFANQNLYNHGYIRFEGDGQRNYFYSSF